MNPKEIWSRTCRQYTKSKLFRSQSDCTAKGIEYLYNSLPNDKILDKSKWTASADNEINAEKKEIFRKG